MAFTVGEVSASITADQKPFNRAMRDVRKKGSQVANDVQKQFRNVGRRMQSVGTQLTAGLTLPLVGAGGMALKTAADFESLRQSMNTLNGSVEEGARNFERLKEFSAGTPFQLKELARAQNMLQGFSLSADEAFESINMIGDIAAVTGGDIQGIGIAFGQAAAEGRLMTRDIRQLINQGVPAIELLADTMDVATSEVLDLASEGEITFDILQQAFRDATEEGGMFANGMKKQAQTLGGIFSTLKDNVSLALNEIGQSLSETFDIKGIMKDMITNIQSGIDWFNSLSEETRRMAFYVAGLLGASGPIIAALGTLSLAIGAITGPVAAVAAAVGVAATAIVKNWNEVEQYFTTGSGYQMWQTIQGIVERVTQAATALWDTFGDNIIETTETMFTVVSEAFRTGLNVLSVALDVWTGRFITDWEGFWQDTQSVARDTFGRDGSMTIIFEEFLGWLNNNWLVRLSSSIGVGVSNAVIKGINATNISDEDIPFIKTINEQLAEQISSRQAERALRRAKDNLMRQLETDDVIIQPDIDISGDTNLGKEMNIFSGAENPIKKASVSTGQLNKNLGNVSNTLTGIPEKLGSMNNGMTATEAALQGIGNQTQQVSSAAQTAGQSLGQMFDQAVLHGKNFMDVLKNIIKQLASRVFVQGVMALITGGSSLVAGSIGSAIFGGLFHSGGIVPGNGERIAKVKGGEGVFTKGQMAAIGNLQMRQSQPQISESRLAGAIGKELDKRLQRLGPEDIYAMNAKGSRGY
jgi:tape measure domain-containing protein